MFKLIKEKYMELSLTVKTLHGRRGEKAVVILTLQTMLNKYHTSDVTHHKSHGWDQGCNSVVEHLQSTLKKKKRFAQVRPKQTYRILSRAMSTSLTISQFLMRVTQTRQMGLVFLEIPKIEMCSYGVGGDSEGGWHER